MILLVIQLGLASLTRLMATPFLMELMVMLLFLTTTIHHTTMLEPPKLAFVDLPDRKIVINANLVILATPVRIISYQVVSLGHLGGFIAL